ncbi:hypothetical protein ACHAP0_008472 [Verticillium nonalfalfae]
MDKKNEDFELRPMGSRAGSRSPGGPERDGFLSRSPSRRPQQQSLVAQINKVDNSPGASILAYCFSSISMTVVNKFVVSGKFWNLNFFYLAVQAIVCVTTIQICKNVGMIRVLAPFDQEKAKKWFPISLLLVGMIYTSTKALQFLSVPVYTIFKNLTIIVIAYGEVLWFGGSVTPLALLSFGLMVLSSVVAAWADIQHAIYGSVGEHDASAAMSTLNAGYAWMGFNVFCTAAYVLGMRKVIKKMNFKDWDTMFYNNLLTIPVLIVCSLLLEDWSSENLTKNFPPATRNGLFVGMIYSGLCAIFISYSQRAQQLPKMLPLINKPFEFLSPGLGVPTDDIKLVFSWLLSYPLAALLKCIPDSRPDLKNIYVISASIFYLVGLFNLWAGLQTLFISSAGTYLIAKTFRHSPFMPWIGFVFVMGHLSINQIIRQLDANPADVDITGAQMVLVMKLSAFCWNVADGQLPSDHLSDLQKDRKLVELPPLLEYAGYVMFFPSLFGGPTFEYVEYRRWLDTSMFDLPPNLEASKKPPVRRQRKVPRSGTPAAWKAASGLMWIAFFVFMSGSFSPSRLTHPALLEHGFIRRVWILYCVGLTARMKYYGAWSLAEGACILTGLGYNGVDPITGKVSWNRLQNIDPRGVELAQNVRGYLGSWNMNTNKWLRNYVYLRVTPRGKKPGFRASLMTFGTSALWHGFYPGYYMTFILASLIQTVAKNFRRYVRPFFLDPDSGLPNRRKKYYDVLSFLTTQVVMSFAVAPFLILSFSGSVLVWSRVYFFAIVGVAVSMGFFASPGKQILKQGLESRQRRPGIQLGHGGSQIL